MTAPVLFILAAMTGVMVIGWLYQRAVHNGGWTDVFWTYGTGITCALAALMPFGNVSDAIGSGATWRHVFIAALVAAWAIRLGTYVALRVSRGPEDVRYATLRKNWGRRFQSKMFWVLIVQAPVTALLGISVVLAARYPDSNVRLRDIGGLLVLVLAILGETVADAQMKRFKADNANAGKVCDRGLWSWSRHPNYFFEALGWFAYPLVALEPRDPASLLSLIAPGVMFIVLRYGTGVPPLEAAMVKSKGIAYRQYQQSVSALMLWPPKKRNGSRPKRIGILSRRLQNKSHPNGTK